MGLPIRKPTGRPLVPKLRLFLKPLVQPDKPATRRRPSQKSPRQVQERLQGKRRVKARIAKKAKKKQATASAIADLKTAQSRRKMRKKGRR